MKIDITSMFFNSSIEGQTATPAWGTSIGQSTSKKCRIETDKEGIVDMVIGMTYKTKTDTENLDITSGSKNRELLMFSVFDKIYINGKQIIDSIYTLLLIRELSQSHLGRLIISYAPYIKYNGTQNEATIDKIRQSIGCDENGCWFVYDISIKNQDELHFSAIVVDQNNKRVYRGKSQDRSKEWNSMVYELENNHEYLPSSPLQTIFFGTPGSGKSHKVSELTDGNPTFRTTFHPDSDYATFVGCYKPIVTIVEAENQTSQPDQYLLVAEPTAAYGKSKKELSYQFVPQAFTNAYVQAWKNLSTPHFLVIEEINRGNCAQIFGDLFQLLDRSVSGFSEYPIQADTDLQKYLAQAFAEEDFAEDFAKVKTGENLILPANLSILATMNTSDQSLFPMDSAFKRRWDWEYVAIDYQNSKSEKFVISLNGDKYAWHDFLKEVNEHIKRTTDSEDKQMGNFFIKGDIGEEAFKSKVMFYIWSEVCKDEFGTRRNFFRNGNEADNPEFSFNELYGSNGIALLQGFMQYIGVEPIALTTENEA